MLLSYFATCFFGRTTICHLLLATCYLPLTNLLTYYLLLAQAAIVADAAKRRVLDGEAAACDAALREAVVALLLLGGAGGCGDQVEAVADAQAGAEAEVEAQPPSEAAGALLRYLDERLCVPRDLGRRPPPRSVRSRRRWRPTRKVAKYARTLYLRFTSQYTSTCYFS